MILGLGVIGFALRPQKGRVKLSVVNESGKEAVVAVLGPNDFLGEGCLTGQPIRIGDGNRDCAKYFARD